MASLRLAALLLAPVSALLIRDRGKNLLDPNPPIANLRMEPETRRLTWDLHGNVSAIQCFEDASFDRRATNNRFCQLFVLPKCKRSNYTVRVTLMDGETYSTWIEYPQQEGDPGAAAEDLGCEVHDQDFLTCSWAVGRRAPSDVQYYFYLEDSSTSRMWACPRYTVNVQGTHTQCRFDNVSAFSKKQQHLFVVRGASRRAPVPCVELTHFLSDIEKLRAPNINATCNESLALLEWDMSSHFHRIFDFELEIQQGADPPFLQEVQQDQSFPLTNPRSFTVRIRALFSPNLIGEWSPRHRFVCDQEANARLHVWLSSSLMALGTLLTMGTAVFLCRRFSVLKTLFPPIPHLKDPLGGTWENEKMFPWEPGRPPQEECPVAEVQVLREP